MARKFETQRTPPTIKEVEEYEMLFPLLESILLEVKELSKKKQDGVLNSVKVKIINKILIRIKNLLSRESTSEFIELLDETALPTNSDALFMLVQFKSAMEQFKSKYYGDRDFSFSWETWETDEEEKEEEDAD